MSNDRTRILLAATALALLCAACATAPAPQCAPGEQRMVDETIYFGRDKPGGVVSSEEWSDFLRTAVTPNFPEGLTVWPASGQWKSADGSIVREDSYVLRLLHRDDPKSEAAIRSATSDYKTRFQQEAVLRVKAYACASF